MSKARLWALVTRNAPRYIFIEEDYLFHSRWEAEEKLRSLDNRWMWKIIKLEGEA